MGKSIGKLIFWRLFYDGLQITMFIGLAIFLYAGVSAIIGGSHDTIYEMVKEIVYKYELIVMMIAGTIVALTYLLSRIIKKEKLDITRIEWDKFGFMVCLGLSFNMILTLFQDILLAFLKMVNENAYKEVVSVEDTMYASNPHWLLLLGVGILVPIVEEIVFRYGICGTIGKHKRTAGIVVSVVLFAIAHSGIFQISYTAILGLAMAVVYTKYNNLWYAIAAHFAFNTMTVISNWVGSNAITYLLGVIALAVGIMLMVCNDDVRHIFSLPKLPKRIPVPQSYGAMPPPVYGGQNSGYPNMPYPNVQSAPYPQQTSAYPVQASQGLQPAYGTPIMYGQQPACAPYNQYNCVQPFPQYPQNTQQGGYIPHQSPQNAQQGGYTPHQNPSLQPRPAPPAPPPLKLDDIPSDLFKTDENGNIILE